MYYIDLNSYIYKSIYNVDIYIWTIYEHIYIFGHVHLVIAVLGIYLTSTTTWNYFGENYYKAILSNNTDS